MAYFAFLILILVAVALVVNVSREVFGVAGIIGHTLSPIAREDREILERTCGFYARLGRKDRREFDHRVKEFIFDKDWIGRGIEITREMRVRISACAVRITMSLDRLLLLQFTRIIVYPDTYLDRMSGKRHFGGTAPMSGAIMLSWKQFSAGDADPADGRHVGLHEMGHALWFEDRSDTVEHDLFDAAALRQWRDLAQAEVDHMRKSRDHFLRDYATANQAEFFAVAIECFFEQPKEYRERLPELYQCMTRLLKQDPAATQDLVVPDALAPRVSTSA